MKKILTLLLLMIFSSTLFTGCKKDNGDPPLLPPVESMEIDFSNFESTPLKGINDVNWTLVSGIAGFWNNIITATLAVPVLSFKLAVDETPVYLDDKTWQWTYTASYLTISYTARLTGQIRSTDVLWKMYITRTGAGGFSEFLWFEGTSELDGTGGIWTLNYSPTDQVPVLEIEWTKTAATVGSVTYTYVKEKLADGVTTNPFNGSYITYGLTTNTYDAYYSIHYYYNTAFADFDVEWSTSTYDGRVMSLQVFGDEEWHYWDSNYSDALGPGKSLN